MLGGGNETEYKEKKNTRTSKENSSTIDDKCVTIISAVDAERVMHTTSSVRLPATPTLCFRSLPSCSGLVVTNLCTVPSSGSAIGRYLTASPGDNTDFMWERRNKNEYWTEANTGSREKCTWLEV
jgi:hypothetical protein